MIGSEALAREIATFPFLADVHETTQVDWRAWGEAGNPDDTTPFRRTVTYFSVDFDTLPEGWTLVGQGCSRTVFRGPDGVCYKVMNSALGHDYYGQGLNLSQNFMEAYNFIEFADIVRSFSGGRARLAACHYFYDLDVLAMEHCERLDSADYYSADMTAFSRVGLNRDLHDDNVWKDQHGTVCVDYAV